MLLSDFIYIYKNSGKSLSEILKMHPFSIVVYIKTPFFSKSEQALDEFLNEYKESSFDYKREDSVFQYKKKFKHIVIRFPIKDTDNLKSENIKKETLRKAFKIVDILLDRRVVGNKIYVNEKTNIKQLLLQEENIANSEFHKKRHDKKMNEIHDPSMDIVYATESDINKARFELGENLFRHKIKYNENLFVGKDIHYDNEYLYERYVKPHEKKKKGAK